MICDTCENKDTCKEIMPIDAMVCDARNYKKISLSELNDFSTSNEWRRLSELGDADQIASAIRAVLSGDATPAAQDIWRRYYRSGSNLSNLFGELLDDFYRR